MTTPITVEEILKENRRRIVLRSEAASDPLIGDPYDPLRFKFIMFGKTLYLPAAMKDEEMVGKIARHKSCSDFLLSEYGAADAAAREKFEADWSLLRSRHDFPFWAASFAFIKQKGGGDDILFRLNRPQRKLVGALEQMRTGNKPIRLILLKARQWGGSTCIQLYMAWLQLVHSKGLNSLIIAHQRCATDEIKDMFDRMISRYPDHMLNAGCDKPPAKRMERVGGTTAATRIIARNCKLKIGSAERPDSCRGGDYNLVHCSEVGLWKATPGKTPEDIHRAASSGILLQPNTMIVMESTANGTGNFFHKEYMAAKNEDSQFKALFIPWYEIEQYALPFSGVGPDDDIGQFACRLLEGREADQPLSDRSQLGEYLWHLWERGATLEAIRWYVAERMKYSDHALMAAEYPSDDVEAFAHSGTRVFDKYGVENLRKDCRLMPIRGEIYGDAPSGPESLRNLRFTRSGNGALLVWRDFDSSEAGQVINRYVVAVDIGSRTPQGDWSVITVIDRLAMLHGGLPEVAAQWRGHSDHDLVAWNAARIAAYYDNALLVIESNSLETKAGGGDSADQSLFILTTLKRHYPNLYARKGDMTSVAEGRQTRYGFHTNRFTKPMIITNLVQIIREGSYIEHDERCLDEYLTYELYPNGSYGAIDGCHDDILMTRAIGLHVCFNEMPLPAKRVAFPSGTRRVSGTSSAAIF